MKWIWLRTARKRANLTQAQLAKRIGKPQSFISKLEIGEITDPAVSDVVNIGREVGVEPLRLRFGRDPRASRDRRSESRHSSERREVATS